MTPRPILSPRSKPGHWAICSKTPPSKCFTMPSWPPLKAAAPFRRKSQGAREIEILQALATGASNKQLAKQMFISEATVKTHLIHIYQKLGVDNRTAAVTVARERKLILRW